MTLDNKIKNQTKKTRRQDKEAFYITSEEIYEQLKIWKQTGEITERFGKIMLAIATGVSHRASFRNYPQDIKDEVIQTSCLYIIKNLKNMKDEFRQSFFNYLTRICYCSWYAYLRKYYKTLNRRKALLLKALEKAFRLNPTAESAAIISSLEKELQSYEHD